MKRLLFTALFLALPAHGRVVDTLKNDYRDIVPRAGEDARRLLERAEVPHTNGELALSGYRFELDWKYQLMSLGDTRCRLNRPEIRLDATLTLPRFSGAHAGRFGALAESLKAHEREHHEQARHAAQLIDSLLDGLSAETDCDSLAEQANGQAQDLLEALKGQFDRYDAETHSGHRQAAYTRPLRLEAPERIVNAQTPAGEPNAPASPDKDGWLPVQIDNGHIRFPITLNGHPGVAMLDSGAEINGIAESFIEAHRGELSFGERIRLRGVYGTEEKQMVSGVDLGLFGEKLRLSRLTPVTLGGADILLGAGFLHGFILQIDYPKQRMRLLPHEAVDMDKFANVELRREKDNSLPAVNVSLAPGESTWLTMDTGNAGGLFLRRSLAEQYGWLGKLESVRHLSGDANGLATAESLRIPYFKIGPYELENVLVTVPGEGQKTNIGHLEFSRGASSGAKSKGLMGYDILKHFVLTLDLKRMKMHIAPPEA